MLCFIIRIELEKDLYLLQQSKTEEAMNIQWESIKSKHPDAWIAYINDGYYGRYKKHWIHCYVNKHMHLGELNSSRVESNHRDLKRYIKRGKTSGIPELIHSSNEAVQVL